MAKRKEELPLVRARTRQEWRAWLEANHAQSHGVWLILTKKGTAEPSVRYDEVVDECLCFGWIDSTVNTVDEVSYKLLITPRKPKSVWSRVNKKRLEKLIEQGLVASPGIARIEAAKQDGSWTALDAIEELTIPADLEEALAANSPAHKHFHAFSNSIKKAILWWIASAKRSETRQNRIRETVELAAQNIKAR